MLAQTIQISFSSYAADTIRIHTGETGREIAFVPDMDISGEYSADFIVIKPDDTFAIAAATITDGKINVEIPEQAGAVAGAGHYILKIYDGGEVCIYSASGGFMVDDHLLTDGIIESVAEVYGYQFPQDFALKSETATLNDNVTDTNSTWSSRKIQDELDAFDPGTDLIDDETTGTDTTWSSSFIQEKISEIQPGSTVTGNPIEITDGASAPLVKCVTEITGYQSGTGTPSPDNIRPIVAYTEGEIEVSDGDGNVTTHTTTYPSAIYRGSEDCVKGEVTSEQIKVIFDGSEDEGWTVSSYRFLVRISDSSLGASTVNLISNLYEGKTANNVYANRLTAGYMGIAANDDSIIVVDNTNFANKDLSAFKAFLSNNPLEVAYELATPTTSSVTPTNLPIKSLSGYTHIESSTGEMEVEYITDEYQPLVDIIPGGTVSYSTTEHKIGTWCDGSDLYEITIEASNINYNAAVQLTIPTNIEIKEIHGIGRIFLSNRFYYMPIGCVSGASISWEGIKIDAEPKFSRLTVNLNAPTGSSQTYVQITIRYTKPLS